VEEKLVQYHDGELSDQQATAVEALLADDPAQREELIEIEQVDQALRDADALFIQSNAVEVAQRQAALKASLPMATGTERISGHLLARHRRTWAAVATIGSLAAALAMALLWPEGQTVVGTARHLSQRDMQAQGMGRDVYLHRPITVTEGNLIVIESEAAQVVLPVLGSSVVFESPNRIRIIAGVANIESTSAVTVVVGSLWQAEVPADASVAISMWTTTMEWWQMTGTSVLTGPQGTSERLKSGDQKVLTLEPIAETD